MSSTIPASSSLCMFPSLLSRAPDHGDRVHLDAELHCVAFQLDVGLEAELFCDSNGLHPASLFQLSWALVLACFVKSDHVVFNFVDLEHGQRTRILSNIDRGFSAAEAVQALQQIEDVVSSADDEAQAAPQAGINTALRVSRDGEGIAAHQHSLGAPKDDARFDIIVDVDVSGDVVSISFQCSPKLLSRDLSAGLASTFGRTVLSIMEQPHSLPQLLDPIQESAKVQVHLPVKAGSAVHQEAESSYGTWISLDQVEQQISINFPGVSAVATTMVTLNHSSSRYQRLIAFLTMSDRDGLPEEALALDERTHVSNSIEELRRVLFTNLQPGLGPPALIPLSHMPRSADGSVAHTDLLAFFSALPQSRSSEVDDTWVRVSTPSNVSDEAEILIETSVEAQRLLTASEEKMRLLWAEVLSVAPEQLGPEDSFFLYGDSASAMDLVAVATRAGLALTVADIFITPTLAELSANTLPIGEGEMDLDLSPFELLPQQLSTIDVVRAAAVQCDVDARSVVDLYPTTALQEGLFALTFTGKASYILQCVCRMPPWLNIKRFKSAWENVAQEFPILRTRIVYLESTGTVQAVLSQESVEWRSGSDLSDYLARDRATSVEYGSVLSRLAIVGQAQQEWHFVWTIHHALYDAWSMALILNAVDRLYGDSTYALSSHVSFNRFVKHVTDTDTIQSKDFWSSYLQGANIAPFPQANQATGTGPSHDTLTSEVSLQRAVASNITVATIVRAAWGAVVARYSDSDDVVFGSTLTGRNAPVTGISDIVGPTIATVPVRCSIDRTHTFAQHLQRTQDEMIAMIPYEHVGLQTIRRWGQDTLVVPDFQNLLVVQLASDDQNGKRHTGLEFSLRATAGSENYAVMVECTLKEAGIVIHTEYDQNVISKLQMERVIRQFQHVLLQLNTESQTVTMADLELVSPYDLRLVEQWNNQELPKKMACIHQLFEEVARAQPEAQAICSWDGDFSYSQLDYLSTTFALHLQSLGVKSEVIVPMMFEKSAWAHVAQLAILKAGGAVVCLDPSHPEGRIRRILADVGATVVLTTSAFLNLLQDIQHLVTVDADSVKRISRLIKPDQTLKRDVHPSNAALVIYTSGSTGEPKGVVLEHASICTGMQAHGDALHIGPQTRALNFSAYVFDASLEDIYTQLTRGGCVCVPSETQRLNDLAGAVRATRANWIGITPTTARTLDPNSVPMIETLILGGELITQKLVDQWKHHVSYMYNGYGPCESTLYATLNPQLGKNGQPSNVGHGLHTKLWVVEPGNPDNLAPVGCSGELLLEGPLLARYYLNDAEKTDAAFITNPAFTRNQQPTDRPRRMYRTGDLVKYTDDGSLEVLGRMDSQAKINGQRLELGEIEHHLRNSSDVESAMVILSSDPDGTKRIMAILSFQILQDKVVVANDDFKLIIGDQRKGIEPTVDQLRKQLQDELPSYMVPTVWVIVDSIPRNTSQKVDRVRVSKWAASLDSEAYSALMGVGVEGETTAPDTPIATQLRSIIARVLNKQEEQLSMNKSFANLGGDSITAMQVVSRCRAERLRLFVKDILHSESLAQLSELVETMDNTATAFGVSNEELNRAFALSPVQQFYFEAMGQKPTQFNQAFLLKVLRPVSVPQLRFAIEAAVKKHSMLRARFDRQGDAWYQHITDNVAGSFRFRIKNLASEEDVGQAFLECQRGLDVENGPLLGMDYLQLQDSSHFLVLAAHHLVIDFVSWRVILKDLEDFLTVGYASDGTPLSFQTWTKLQAEYAYEHIDPQVALPFDINDPDFDYWGMAEEPNLYGDIACHTFLLDQDTTSHIFSDCNSPLSSEPVEILTAAAIHSFCRTFTDRETPTVWREAHGREPWSADIDLSSTVGWFTNLAPLQINVPVDNDIVTTLRAVKDTSRRLPQNGWPYFTSRYLTANGREKFKNHSSIELLFNYVGRFQQLEGGDTLFQLQEPHIEELEPAVGRDVPRMSLLEISVSHTSDGKLKFRILYNDRMKHIDFIYRWGAAYDQTLRDAAALLPGRKLEKTLSDYPLLRFDYKGLQTLRTERIQQLGLFELGDIEAVYPTAPMQEALLVGQALHAGAYETNATLEVTTTNRQTPVDVDRLQAAWETVIAYHPMLRTIFADSVAEEGLYDQVVLKSFNGFTRRIRCEDECGPATLIALEYMKLSKTKPLHRFVICTTPSGKVYCRMDFHHAMIDATSLRVLLDDIRLAYDGGLNLGNQPQFSEYIKYLQTKSLGNALGYWEDRLSQASPCHFPVASVSEVAVKEMRELEADLQFIRPLLRNFISRTGVTLPNLVQTAWALVLHSYSGLDSVSFGYLVSGRNVDVKGVDRIVGPLINMLVCHVDAATSTNVIDLLHATRDQYAESLDHQHVSLGRVQHTIGLSAATPLFNTAMSSLHNSSTISKFQSRNAQAKRRELFFDVLHFHDPTEYDIIFTLKADDHNPNITFAYWSPRVSDWLARNALASLTSVIRSLIEVASVDGPLSELESVSSRDREILQKWNNTPVEEEYVCIHHVIQQRVKATPNAEAICNANRSMTYGEMDGLSTRLAAELQRKGVGPEVVVPICFEKNTWAVVAILACLKAGGAYVPLDPRHPEYRIRQIIESKGVYGKLILTSENQASLFSSLDCETLVVDEKRCQGFPNTPLAKETVTPKNLAYVIFTSGTTGKPKGTMIEHRAFATSARDHSKAMEISSSSRVLQFSSYVFDVSVMDILTTLMQGGCICIPTDEERESMEIVGAINRMRVNWTLLTPSFVTIIEPSQVPGLKTLVLGGEAMSQKHVEIWGPHVRLMNAYGPTEASVLVTINTHVTDATNIGHGVGALTWIADRNNADRLVPMGAVGELLLEGPTLARGYLNEPAKTRAAFVDSPSWAPGRRFYKTGDLVRLREDGSHTYLGRKDSQVKVRGQRLEIGEIEHQLDASRIVRDAVVVMPTVGPRQKTLIAVVTLTALRFHNRNGKALQIVDQSLQAGHVREVADHLGQTLPSYMVPAVWIVVEAMPLNTSGKLDRKRVIKWVERLGTDFYHRIATDDNLTSDASSQPATDMESQIRTMVSEILNIPNKQLSLTQSFIGLGGDSITAMQMVSRCRSQGIALKMTDILRSKTMSKMAQAAKSIRNTQQQHVEISQKPFELSPIQLMFEEMGGIPDMRFNQSFYLRVDRPITHKNLEKAIATIVGRHPMLRAHYLKNAEGNWRQFVQRTARGRYYTASHDLRRSSLAVSIMEASQHRLHPDTGPLFSADLLNVTGDGQFLYLVAHHLVIDLVSWRIILQDLEQLLLGRNLPTSDSLPFQSWLALQATHASSLDVNTVLPFQIQSSDLAYWDMEGKANIYADVERHEFPLTKDVSTRLLEQCHTALGTEPVEILLAALFHSFAIVFPDRATPTVFSEGHGREPWNSSLDVSNTVGWFTTMSPLHISVSGDSVIDIVRKTKDVRRSITRNGFDYFASRYLTAQGQEAFGKSGSMEVLFNYLGQFQGLEREDSLLRQQALPEGAAQSDFDEKLTRFALFEINATVAQGILSFQFLYNKRMARKADVLRWAGTYAQSLDDITELLPTMASEKTLIDFPLVPLTYGALQNIQETILPDLGLTSLDDLEDLYPLTPMQNGLILSQTRNSDTYKTSFTFKVTSNRSGNVDRQRLLEAWQSVVDSHAMLRTVFTDRTIPNGVFYQLVLAKCKANTLLLSCESDEEAVSLLENWPVLEYTDSVPPHRFIACQVHSGSIFFRFDANHALVDADSVGVLLRDLSQAYEGKEPLSVGPLYSDYIKYLDSTPMETSVTYWSEYLQHVVPCYVPMINDVQDTVSPLRSIHLSLGNLSSLMRKFCATCSVTMSSVFHLAWSIVLRLYTGAEDVAYGYLVSGRDVAVLGITKTIGPFINMMVSRTRLSPSATISSLVQKKQSEYASGIEHQACSLAQIQHALGLSDQPLFNSMISVQALGNKKTSDELALAFEGISSRDPTEYDISLGIYSDNENAEAHFGYWADRMSDWHAENVAQTFEKVLEQMLSYPEGNVDSVRQLSERDMRQVQSWTPLQRPGSGALVHIRFADQVARAPKSLAIESFEGRITYSELDDISTNFSQHLINLSVRPGTVVPFCFSKSAWAIVAMLAILKAGGTGLPLSPDHPLDRVRTMVLDCSANLIICAPDQASRLSALGLQLIHFSKSLASTIPKTSPISVAVDPESSAFLIYTSGSTGIPKGVMIPHRAITTNVPEIAQTWGWDSNSRILQFIAYTFDPMLGDIFGALFTGACLCIISDHDRMKDITPVINNMKVSHIVLTPSLARTLQPEKLTSLKSIVCGGEAITERDIEMWKGHVELINAYGPTEATIAVTSLHYSRRGGFDARNIGRPLRFSSLWVADAVDIKWPVPVGAVGELLIGGQTLANGYLNDEEKTRNAFVNAPKWTGLGESKVYRTGDLVRWAFDGTIHFVGRKDTQIKIRGQRVEAGEIENAIRSNLPGLKDVAVALTTPQNRSVGPVLTAFLSWNTELESHYDSLLARLAEPLTTQLVALDAKLADALPSYMIPAMYIPLQCMPLTVSGKTDVSRLQSVVSGLSEPELAHFSLSDGPKLQPSTRIEKKLQQIWSEVLDLQPKRIGQDDSFFRLGGDSLSAIQLTSRASQDEIHLTIALIFQNPKLSDMAAAAEDLSSQSVYYQLQEQFGILKESVQDFYQCTPLQESLMILSMKRPGSYRQRHAWTLPASVNVDLLKTAVNLVAQKEPILRTRIVNMESTGSMQVVIKEDIDITETLSEAEFWVLERSMTMAYGQPLLKCCVVQQSEEAPKLLLTIHHVLYDEWSINLLLNSIEAVYQGVVQDEAVSFKVESSSLSDFMHYFARSNEGEAEAYWKNQLSGASPVDFPRLPSASHQPGKCQILHSHFELPAKQSTSYELPVFLKAAWSIIMARYSGTDDITFGLTVQGRDVPVEGIDTIVGPTLATVPLRMHIDWNTSIEQFISSIRDQASDMKSFEHVGLQRIAQSAPEAENACNFQHLLVIHDRRPIAASKDFWIETPIDQIEELVSYPLTLQCYLNGSVVEVAVSYDEMVLDAHQLELMLANFEQTLGQLVTTPDHRPLKSLDLLGNYDRRVIMELNSTVSAGLETRIDQLFEIQRAARPNAEAVHSWDAQFTYQQLYEHAIRLAHHLQVLGVGPEVLVPLCFDKSAWTIVAQLGVLYAGGAFVVMDATHPVQRLQQLIKDTNAHLVLASASREDLCRTFAPQVVPVSPETVAAFPNKASPPFNKATPRNTAYVLFTSGSTGKPKGVVTEHRGVCTAAMEQGKRINMNSSSRVLQYASYAFDSTILETFHTLFHGGCICPLSQEQRMNDIVGAINQLQANWAFFTPSLVRTFKPEQVPCLKTVVLGGEALGKDNIEAWANQTCLVNGYGPTETCVFSSILDRITESDRPDNIGRAVGGANWVVDAHDTNVLVPIGAVGELLIEGPTVARGYLNDNNKTEEAFIKRPVWLDEALLGRPVERVYKTGDIVTMRPDGTVLYIGRKDTQIKIRGQRVELGEIEHSLKRNLPHFAHLVVHQIRLPRRDNTKVLAAFLCRDGKEKEGKPETRRIDLELYSDLMALTSTITDALPAYMIPTMFILLDSMPLSGSGKTDRRRLHAVAETLTNEEITHFSLADVKKRTPLSEIEKKMQSMWATVLSIPVESIGCDDSFLRLGGDSISAMKLAALARKAGISIMVDHIFRNPTLSAMSSITTKMMEGVAEDLKAFSLLRGLEPLEAILEKLEKTYSIPRQSVQDIYPTSSLQEGLMVLSVRQPGTYNFQWNAVLPPSVDRERFQRAWQICVKRNTILRTRIIYTELSGSLQVVLDDELQWTTTGSLEDYLKADKLDIMDYGKSLSRWAIVDDDSGKTHFVWSAHHSIYDGWALPLVLREVARIYHATDVSRLSTPPPYACFIKYLESRDQDAEITYWQSQYPKGKVLSNFPPVQSSAIQPLANVTVTKVFDFAPGNSSTSGITTATLIRAAWAIVLSRYAEVDHALFGALLAGRNVPIKDIASMTGPTITTVPVHIQVSRDQTVHAFLDDVQRQAVEMMPFEHTGLQNIKQFTREAYDACNFQNLLVIQPKQESSEADDLWRTGDTIDFAFDEFLTYPLVFQVVLGSTLGLTLKLDDRLLSAERGQRMLEHFSHVIQQLSEANTQTLADIDITSPIDLAELQQWNDPTTVVKPTTTKTVHNLIIDQARQSPNSAAVCSWDGNFTYAELDTLSTRVATHLRNLGVDLETYVLFCFDKSAWAIIAMLGILKAGAAYVAVDPMHPPDRKAFIAREVLATVAVTSPQHQHMFYPLVDHVIGIDRISVEDFAFNRSLPSVPPSNPAFVVFTSGSTGTPKGIVMEHGAFSAGALSHAPALNINCNARVLQFAAYTYDVSMGEIFSTLMHGGCVCVPTEEERLSNLAGATDSMCATWLFLTPTVASLVNPASVPTLQYVILGGEHATTVNIQSWAEHVHLTNSYGPAECAIWTNHAAGLKCDADPSNIGHRIGSQLWIVEADNHDRLIPTGCIGELVVESHSLARGYLNDPAKTAAAFIEAPKWAGAGRRMYKTGDLAKYNFDGTLSIVGRKDNQVKLNGQRMELGEVEHHLCADEEVNKAMAIVPTAGPCKEHLVSVVSLKTINKTLGGAEFVLVGGDQKKEVGSQISRLREKLGSKLPKYMIPTFWIVLEDLPLNASGKLDRRRVSEWIKEMDNEKHRSAIELAQSDKIKTKPSNKIESSIRRLWSKVLGVGEETLSMDDNFLQIGGDSISAVRLTAAARQEGITLLVREIFQKPVLRAMSAAAKWEEVVDQVAYEPFSVFTKDQKKAALENVARKASQPIDNIEDVLEATDYQSWTLAAGHLRTRGYINYFGIRFEAKLDMKELRNACWSVIARHPILRTVLVVHNQRLLQVVLRLYEPDYTCYEYQDKTSDEAIPRALIEKDMGRPVNLGDGMMRFILVKQRDNSHCLVLRISHAQYDGISLPSILQDIKAAYEGSVLSNSKPYSSFIYNVRKQDPHQCETFWSAFLRDSHMTNILRHKKLPYKNPVNRMLSRAVTPSSLNIQGVTFATTVKAAWALVLSSLALTSDTVFGQVVSGRNGSLAGIQHVVGPCMNILPYQHLASMPYENYGMRQIIERCTSWPKATRFSSIHQHTNFGKQFFGEVLSASAGSEMTGYSPPHDVADVWIWTAPVSEGMFSVDLTFADSVLGDEIAQLMLDMLCNNIESISANQDARILMPSGSATRIPIAYDEEKAKAKYFAEVEPQAALSITGAEKIVAHAWEKVFGADASEDQDLEWWDIRGDLMPAVHLAEIYSKATGASVSVESVIENGSRNEQIRLLRGE
ncbi:uncharacterized protein N0V89_004146 [Didymosphaeria variabile]|uniref:Carrier domain-containing protein n=1 Tax=Didymosphaeria variabile TaxID=1932322 RepID=A0A9W8XRL5_9PLEO|nr:uncharacterized protein N0V89_004146 [Didymosphaeria variabile]KAJ4356118.1 hypothetical protein N0V89_004146 [Didymosphaeria variabile]